MLYLATYSIKTIDGDLATVSAASRMLVHSKMNALILINHWNKGNTNYKYCLTSTKVATGMTVDGHWFREGGIFYLPLEETT